MGAVSISPATTEGEAATSLAIRNAAAPAFAASAADEADAKAWYREHLELVASLDGEPVGAALVALEPGRESRRSAQLEVAVLPTSRRRGAGGGLCRAASAWARERGLETIEAWICDEDPDGLAFATGRGFVPVQREGRLALDLAGLEPPPATPPAGVSIVTLAERPDLLEALHAIACEAFPDIPGEGDIEPPGFDEWRDAYMGGAGDSPDATFVALERGRPVGYAKLHLSGARPGVVLHDITAVRRDRRRRGIARALKAAEIAWSIAAGYERLETANEARNEPIRRLNEKLGYRELPGRTLVRGPLVP